MNISIISFTLKGGNLNKRINEFLSSKQNNVTSFTTKSLYKELNIDQITTFKEWTEEAFNKNDALIFIGASGIAVRAIAPYIKSKDVDPAVIVIDEEGNFVIPVLSGHIGGANDLAKEICDYTMSIPVITTATDINGKFAVDNFAVKNKLIIKDINKIKVISSNILKGNKVSLLCDGHIEGNVPSELSLSSEGDVGIVISAMDKDCFKERIKLIPKSLVLGIGCKKNTPMENIEELVLEVLQHNNIFMESIKMVASIDLKKHEEGLINFCNKYNKEFKVFSASELEKAKGEFTSSTFVKSITGVNNVCERAAVVASKQGNLIIKKTSKNGVTVAIAEEEWSVRFE